MRSPITLTVEVANQFLQAPENVSLQEYEVIEDAAAEALTKYNSSLYLDGLTSLSCSAANALVQHKGGYLSLNGITSLSEMSVGALGALLKYDGVIMLGGVQYLSEEAVGILAMHKGPLHLEGLTLFPDRPVDLTTLREPPPASMPKDGQGSQDKHYGLGNEHETVDEFAARVAQGNGQRRHFENAGNQLVLFTQLGLYFIKLAVGLLVEPGAAQIDSAQLQGQQQACQKREPWKEIGQRPHHRVRPSHVDPGGATQNAAQQQDKKQLSIETQL